MSIIMFLTLVGSCDWAKKDLGIEDYKAKYEAAQESVERLTKEVGQLKEELAKLNEINDKLTETLNRFVKKTTWKEHFKNNQIYNKETTTIIAKEVVALAKKHGNKHVKITVEGYSSKIGDADYNMWLSKERAEGVMHKICSLGNDNNDLNIEVIAHGSTDLDQRAVIVTLEVLPCQ